MNEYEKMTNQELAEEFFERVQMLKNEKLSIIESIATNEELSVDAYSISFINLILKGSKLAENLNPYFTEDENEKKKKIVNFLTEIIW